MNTPDAPAPDKPVSGSDHEVPAARLERRKLIATAAGIVLGVLAPALFIVFDGTDALRDLAEGWTASPAAAIAVYLLIAGAAFEVIGFPIDFYSGYWLERKFGLSRSSFGTWLFDYAKAEVLQAALIIAAIEGIYLALRTYPETWWLIVAAGFTLFAVVLAGLAPVLLFRLFFKFEPLEDGELKRRLTELSVRIGAEVRGVYVWKLGEKTRRANAALAGWGRTRRILLADTLIEEYTEDEIEVVMAHELAHHVHGDIWRALLLRSALAFGAFYAVHLGLGWWSTSLGYRSISDFANIPLLLLIAAVVSFASMPLANAYSRRQEHAADEFALKTTGKASEFASAMAKLASQNLSRRRSNRIVEFLFHSHPSAESRIRFANEFAASGDAKRASNKSSETVRGELVEP